jgi:alginate O-acetyltransferase complex protein AlgI
VALARLAWVVIDSRLLAIALLPGLSLVLHFGIFNLLAGVGRLAGAHYQSLFVAPPRSMSLAEFWGRRWNLAFSQMTALVVYRPLVSPYGRGPALVASFLGSGLRHELAVSVPVQAGCGLPLAYLALHGVLSLIEHRLAQSLDLAESESCPPGLNFADIREIRVVSPGNL